MMVPRIFTHFLESKNWIFENWNPIFQKFQKWNPKTTGNKNLSLFSNSTSSWDFRAITLLQSNSALSRISWGFPCFWVVFLEISGEDSSFVESKIAKEFFSKMLGVYVFWHREFKHGFKCLFSHHFGFQNRTCCNLSYKFQQNPEKFQDVQSQRRKSCGNKQLQPY